MSRPIVEIADQQNGGVGIDLLGVLPAGTMLHGYELLSVLGHGGFGITYLARHASLGREVAIKEYLPRDLALRHGPVSVLPRSTELAGDFNWIRERFLDEARNLVKLETVPGIVRVLDLFEANGTAYTVMALARGDTLEQRLDKHGRLPAPVVDRLLWPLLDGLERVHAVGFVHRDIKPANIILDSDDRPTLIDFGAARMAMAGRTVATMTAMYTPAYAAPEQFAAAKQGAWTDIYGLSATLYHVITGNRPPSAMERTLDGGYELLATLAPSGFPLALLAGIDAGMTVRPAERPQSIAGWRHLLRRSEPKGGDTIIVGMPKPPPSPPAQVLLTPPAPSSSPSLWYRRPFTWVGLAAAVLMLAVGGYVGTSMFSDPLPHSRPETAAEKQSLEDQARRQAEAQAAEQLKRPNAEQEQRQAEAAAEKQRLDDAARRQAEAQEADRLTRQNAEQEQRQAAEAAEKQRLDDEARRQAEALEAEQLKRQKEEQERRQAEAAAEKQRLENEARDRAEIVAEEKKLEEAEHQRVNQLMARLNADLEERRKADADAARARAVAAEKQAAEKDDAALGLIDRKRCQVALSSLGFGQLGDDGQFGPRTRQAIAAWQNRRGSPESGFLTAEQQRALFAEARLAIAKYDDAVRKAEEARRKPVAEDNKPDPEQAKPQAGADQPVQPLPAPQPPVRPPRIGPFH